MVTQKRTLYCLPFAGGGSYSYRSFKQYLPDFITMIPIELPGRGKRSKEPLLTDLEQLADDVFYQLQRDGIKQPYAIFGHSMGACLGYLVTQRICQAGLPLPSHLFVSGHQGPSLKRKETVRYDLPKTKFIAMLKDLEGSPKEVLEHPELIEFFEPVIRADFKAVEQWIYQPVAPVDVPITIFWGTEDKEVDYARVLAWQQVSLQPLVIKQFSGGHFFIFEHVQQICPLLSQ
jgi:surfactin synthase thioesterase subunit